MLRKGFIGSAIVTFDDGYSFGFRFLSADFSLNQGVNLYLSSEGGSEKRRIISPSTGDLNGRITSLLGENLAQTFYDWAYEAKESTVQLWYNDGQFREFRYTKVESLNFECKGGDIIQVSIDCLSREDSRESEEDFNGYDVFKSYRQGTEKLVQWTQSGIDTSIFSGDKASFSYTIKNNLVTVKTAQSLLPRAINRGVQEVSGNIVIADLSDPPRDTILNENEVIEGEATFHIDNWEVTHRIAAHWSYRTPLSPEIVLTTLDWTRVDELLP